MYACRNRHTHRHTRTFRPLRTHAHKRVRAHTTHQHTHSLPQLLPLPQDSARGLWGQGAEPGWPVPGTLLASLPGDTHPTDRDDRAGHPRAGPAHAEPAAKQRRNHCAASAAPQAAAGTSWRKAWPRRRACAVRSRSTSPLPLPPAPPPPPNPDGGGVQAAPESTQASSPSRPDFPDCFHPEGQGRATSFFHQTISIVGQFLVCTTGLRIRVVLRTTKDRSGLSSVSGEESLAL